MYVSQVIAQAIATGGGRIIISAPPRHGKSELIDVYLPAWVLEHFPRSHVILTSYGADLSEGFGRRCRDLILDNEEALNVRLNKSAMRVDDFWTSAGGRMSSVGVGGVITGKGADVLIIDDYIKEIKEALSPAHRDYVWNWFATTAYTRLEPNSTCIIIATRWHSDDLIGRILQRFPGKWTNIVLPAIAEQDDILGRAPGEALFPERYPLHVLMERHEVLGSSFFQALFQQRPVDEARKLADASWLNQVEIVPWQNMSLARVWDLAATEEGGDFTVGALCGYDRESGFFYVLNIVRDQLSPQAVEQLVLKTAIADGVSTKIFIEQEGGSAGKALVEHYQNTVLPEFQVENIPVVTAKVIRAQPMLAAAEAGKVFVLKGEWNSDFYQEFDSFPGLYDDQIDTVGAGYTKLSGKRVYSATWGRKESTVDSVQNSKKLRQAQAKAQGRRTSYTWGGTYRK